MARSEAYDLIEKPPVGTPISKHTGPPPVRANLLIFLSEPIQWLKMLSKELNPSFVIGVFLVYGLSQGFSGSLFRVVSDYYWKDVQRLQPSAVQLYSGFYYIPWIMKPIWGLLTDVFPIYGYRRRPYFIFAGVLGVILALIVSIHARLPVIFALVCLVGLTAGVAISDVTIDACIARNSIEKAFLAPDMQSLSGFCSSVGALLGYASSGMFVHVLGAQGALGILAVPPALLVVLGFLFYELKTNQGVEKKKAFEKVSGATRSMYTAIKCPQVWKPSLYMFLSLALSISTHEGQFYWYTDPTAGPAFSQVDLMEYQKSGMGNPGIAALVGISRFSYPKFSSWGLRDTIDLSSDGPDHFRLLSGLLSCIFAMKVSATRPTSKEFVGMIYAIGAMASIAGVLIYHKILKDYQFRNLLFFAQLLYSLSGTLDLIFVLRWNLKLGIPDYLFVVMEESCSRIISKIRWMPMMVLSTKLCPLGIEGTFFALLMCIDSLGGLSSKLGGGIVLHLLHVTRTDFTNLWLVVLIRNLLRISTLGLIFLVPRADQSDILLPSDLMTENLAVTGVDEENMQLVAMNHKTAV